MESAQDTDVANNDLELEIRFNGLNYPKLPVGLIELDSGAYAEYKRSARRMINLATGKVKRCLNDNDIESEADKLCDFFHIHFQNSRDLFRQALKEVSREAKKSCSSDFLFRST